MRCEECHSPHHRDRGTMMSVKELTEYACAQEENGATAIVLLGGTTSDYIHKVQLRTVIQVLSKVLPVGLYSGDEQDALFWGWRYLTWYKVGPYIKQLGGLESPTTNQRFYRRNEYGEWELRNDLFNRKNTK